MAYGVMPEPATLGQLELAGVLGDGGAGALCTLPAAARVGTGGVNTTATCKGGAACVPFASDPLAGTRYGYCKKATSLASFVSRIMGRAKPTGVASLRDVRVADRVTVLGVPCRLPLVVK